MSDQWIDDWLEASYDERNGDSDPMGAGSFDCEEAFFCPVCDLPEEYCQCP